MLPALVSKYSWSLEKAEFWGTNAPQKAEEAHSRDEAQGAEADLGTATGGQNGLCALE